jgi:signal transduction histidine kinase/HPt (histidine-containing phosphotransfer) domain-containing protein
METDTILKLLVIDDDDVDRMQLKRALAASEFKYSLSESPLLDNLDSIDSLNTFDCIFLDYLLPGDNGLTVVKKMRKNRIKTPVVIITSQGNESIAVELMKAGASDYLVKNDINGRSLEKVLRNVLAIGKMIREREEAEQALRISESRLAQAQRIAKIGNWEFTADTNSFYFSEEAYRTMDIPPGTNITVESFVSRLHPEDRAWALEAWREVLQGRVLNIDFRVLSPNGIKYTNSQGYAITDNTGKVEKIVGTLQDITERKLADEEISKARELAENSIKVREVFLANMSHEIRTPMNAILGFTELLYETHLNAEQRRYIDAIHFSGENLLVVINDILDLSKIRSGKLSIDKCDFDLHGLVTKVISVMSAKAREKGIHLSQLIDRNIPRTIIGDPVRLNQILTNLIANAIKFTQKGSVTLTVTSNTSENQNILIEFNVIDTGIGIPEEMQSAIFDNFVQASNDTTRRYGGTGLGLTIVKSLVELQHGEISLTSHPGIGSNFLVKLPFEQARAANAATPPQTLPQHESLEKLSGISVLVAEDNNVNQLLIRKVLEKVGCKIDITSGGVEALERLATNQYDIVLMDIQMPGMDGYEATRRIRNELPKPLCEIPIIAMTAHAFGSDVTRCLAAGMNDYISKPFKASDLYTRILKNVSDKKDVKDAKQIHLTPPVAPGQIDLSTFRELGRNDATFINELAITYDKQTPAFIEQLKTYTKSQNYEAINALCHQIKSSYGILKMPQLDKTLQELSTVLNSGNPPAMIKVTSLVETIIPLIASMNDQVQRGLKRTG